MARRRSLAAAKQAAKIAIGKLRFIPLPEAWPRPESRLLSRTDRFTVCRREIAGNRTPPLSIALPTRRRADACGAPLLAPHLIDSILRRLPLALPIINPKLYPLPSRGRHRLVAPLFRIRPFRFADRDVCWRAKARDRHLVSHFVSSVCFYSCYFFRFRFIVLVSVSYTMQVTE